MSELMVPTPMQMAPGGECKQSISILHSSQIPKCKPPCAEVVGKPESASGQDVIFSKCVQPCVDKSINANFQPTTLNATLPLPETCGEERSKKEELRKKDCGLERHVAGMQALTSMCFLIHALGGRGWILICFCECPPHLVCSCLESRNFGLGPTLMFRLVRRLLRTPFCKNCTIKQR